MGVFHPDTREGRYIYYGVREHGMAAAMNGMALHGGARPYGGTFMCFTDYARGSMRLSALMGVPTTLCHDPRQHRPWRRWPDPPAGRASCDAARHAKHACVPPCRYGGNGRSLGIGPDIHKHPFRAVPDAPEPANRAPEHKNKNLTAQGGYVLADAEGKRQAIIMATGSEVAVALAARDLLQAEGIGTRVVSMPC